MDCKGFLGCLLKLLNLLLTLLGLAMVGYGVYMFIMYKNAKDDWGPQHDELIQLGRPMLMVVSLSTNNIFDNLPTLWFIYLFVGVGAILFGISCFGCIGAATRSRRCLTCYSVLVIFLIMVEVGCDAFIFFDKSWGSKVPVDKTADFNMMYGFIEMNWNIWRWVALGVGVLLVLVFLLAVVPRCLVPLLDCVSEEYSYIRPYLLALMVRAPCSPSEYDSDEEYITGPTQQRQPLIGRQPHPATGTLDSRPSRNDAWSARMRAKYGLDTSEFTYNPNESNRHQQVNVNRCTIM